MRDKKATLFILIFLFILTIDIFGYILIENVPFLEALYMTVITISTVGYGEIFELSKSGRLFTIWVILSGLGMFLYFIGNFAVLIIDRNLRKIFGRRKMKKIGKITNHIIVAGFGTLGEYICRELSSIKEKFLIIEINQERYNRAEERGYNVLLGDASDDEILISSGVTDARAFISLLSSDAENIISMMTVKELNPGINAVTRAIEPANESKLLKSGANKVIKPNELITYRMINSALNHNIGDFIDYISFSPKLSIGIEEFPVDPKSSLNGKKIIDSGLRKDLNLIIIAIKKGEEIIFNPSPDHIISDGDILLIVGEKNKLLKFKQE